MALGSIAGSIAGGVASAGASALASSALGGDDGGAIAGLDQGPPGIKGGGLSGRFSRSGNFFRVRSTPEREGLVSNIARTFPEQAGLVGELRSQVQPGMSALREARLGEIESARQRSIGNLRENLQRRRVLGSSFGADALSRAEAEFGQLAERTQAETFLQELELTQQLVDREFTLRRGEFQTNLDELDLQAETALQLAGLGSAQLGANARLKAQLGAQAAAGRGQFIGDITQPIAESIGGAVSSGVESLFG